MTDWLWHVSGGNNEVKENGPILHILAPIIQVVCGVTDNRFELHCVDMFHPVHRTVESVFPVCTSGCLLPLKQYWHNLGILGDFG